MTSISPLSDSVSSPTMGQPQATMAAKPASAPAPTAARPKTKSKPRKRANTAEKRHQHNAIERARRETLNTKFLTLARLLPSLANHRRPSKSAIVNGSISHVTHQREQRLLAANLLKQLCSERDELFEEANEWRKASGLAPRDGPSNIWNDDMEEVCSVEQEVFGNFASMGGDDDGEDEVEMTNSISEVPQFAVPSINGLITPRSSTDIDPMSHPMMFQQQQQQQQQHQAQQHRPQPPPSVNSVNLHGINWSQDFATQFQQAGSSASNPTPSLSNNTPLPFSAFMSDSTESPGTSNLGNSIMLTPPTTADLAHNGIFTHTPSPRPSSASVDDKSSIPVHGNGNVNVNSAPTQQWTPQQLLFLQQIQQHQAQVRQHQQNLANHYSAFPGNVSNQNANGNNGNMNAANQVDGFTQSLINTMFPQQAHVTSNLPHHTNNVGMGMGMGMNMATALGAGAGVGLEQVQQWRKAALTSYLQQNGNATNPNTHPNLPHGHGHGHLNLAQLKSGSPYQAPMLTPGGVNMGMGLNGTCWSPENAVEGF